MISALRGRGVRDQDTSRHHTSFRNPPAEDKRSNPSRLAKQVLPVQHPHDEHERTSDANMRGPEPVERSLVTKTPVDARRRDRSRVEVVW